MKLVKPSVEILYCDNYFLKLIERAGRLCYRSEHKITDDSYKGFIKGLLNKGHETPIEMSMMSVKFITNRGISAELCRHRLVSINEVSTRYVNFTKRGIGFIVPFWYKGLWDNVDKVNNGLKAGWTPTEIKLSCGLTEEEKEFLSYLLFCEKEYNKMVGVYNLKPEQARNVLPLCLKTELIMTANFREWRHILKLRMSSKAHPQMREIMIELYNKIRLTYPEIFDIVFSNKG